MIDFESLIRLKALQLRYSGLDQIRAATLDACEHQADEAVQTYPLKKVQFLAPADLHEQLRSVCDYLNLSQRQFLESVTVDAIDRAWNLIEREKADPDTLGFTVAEEKA